MNRKRNEFLDAGDSEEEDIGRDSDIEEDTRIRALPAKRRKLNTAADEDGSESEHSVTDDENAAGPDPVKKSAADHLASTKVGAAGPLKPLTPAQFAASQAKARKTGVIYISRIPPFMKPSLVRTLLSRYGEIARIFLTPEPTPSYQKRVKAGGNKKRSFVDGWVEFVSKKKAKIVAETLNGNTIGGRKGSWYHDDIWNIKYLKGFKWADLMEQVQNEEREREGRMRVEVQREAKERKAFLTNLEQDRRQRGMEEKRRKKKGREVGEDEAEVIIDSRPRDSEQIVEGDAIFKGGKKAEMRFRQHEVRDKSNAKGKGRGGDIESVASKLFG
jgi:ESF2/ABP1 family protein